MESLSKRVSDLLDAHSQRQPITRYTATDEAIVELSDRLNGLDDAVRLIAVEVEKLTAGS